MKKLALASVALAGVAAFGAGDAFASGITFYTSYASFAASGESVNDSLDFGLLTGLGGGISGPVTPTITTAGGAQTFSHLSQSGKNTVLGSFLANSLPSALAVAYQTPGHILGFSTGAALYGEGAGTLKISFLHPVVAFEALLAPGSTNFT